MPSGVSPWAKGLGKPRAVADRRDGRIGCRQERVDPDPVLGRQSCLQGEFPVRQHADADEDEVCGQLSAVREGDADGTAVPSEDRRHARPEGEAHAHGLLSRAEERAHLCRDRPGHGALGRLDHRHGEAAPGRDGGEFEPDEAGAHHHDRPGGLDLRLERVGIREVAQLTYTREFGPGHGQRPVPRAGGEHEVVVGQVPAVRELQPARRPVDRDGPNPRPVRDRVLGEEAGRAQEQPLLIGLAGEVGLRQGRPLVGKDGLVAHQGDRIPEPTLAQGGGELEARLAGARDDDPGRAHALAPASARPLSATPGRLRAPSDIR